MRRFALILTCMALIPAAAAATDMRYGVGIDLEDFSGASPAAKPQRLREVGASAVLLRVAWADIEPKAGRYSLRKLDSAVATLHDAGMAVTVSIMGTPLWASRPDAEVRQLFEKAGYAEYLTSLPPDEYGRGRFARTMRTLAKRYRSRVSGYEIRPEPDGAGWADVLRDAAGRPLDVTFGARAAQYLPLLREAYRSIKKADPDALVACGGLAERTDTRFISDLLALDGDHWLDAVALHPWGRGTLDWRWVESTADVLRRNGEPTTPLWITAWGFSSSGGDWNGTAPKRQAEWIGRALDDIAARETVRAAFYTNLYDKERSDGLFDPEGEAKPAAAAFAKAATAPPLYITAAAPDSVCFGSTFALDVAVRNEGKHTARLVPDEHIDVTAPEFAVIEPPPAGPVTVPPGEVALLAYNVRVGDAQEGRSGRITVALLDDGTPVRRAHLTVTPTQPLTATVSPQRIVARPGTTAELQVSIRNNLGKELQIELSSELSGEEVSRRTATLPAVDALTIPLPAAVPENARPGNMRLSVRVDPAGQAGTEAGGVTASATVSVPMTIPRLPDGLNHDGYLTEWSDVPAFEIVPPGEPWRKSVDLRARGRFAWDNRYLHLAVRVLDDQHDQPFEAAQIWKGDGVQLALDPPLDATTAEGHDANDIEMGMCLGPAGPHLFRWTATQYAPAGVVSTCPLAIRREEVYTTYELSVPWEEMGLTDTAEGHLLGASVLVNEADPGEGRTAQGWCDGISQGKWPIRFCALELGPALELDSPPRRQYIARNVASPPSIDGNLDEETWRKAEWHGGFTVLSLWGGGSPDKATEIAMAYDAENLYIAAVLEDDDAWSDRLERDSKVWEGEAIEIYIDPLALNEGYYEYEISPKNSVIDLQIREPGFEPWQQAALWNCDGWRTATRIEGQRWTVETALPLSCISTGPPRSGDAWRIQIYRIERERPPNRERSEFSSWSPSRNFHVPWEFGEVRFGGEVLP